MINISEILTGRVIPYSEHKVHLSVSALCPVLEGDTSCMMDSPHSLTQNTTYRPRSAGAWEGTWETRYSQGK